MDDRPDRYNRIATLKKKRNAVILAHVYQREEVQDIADFVGDSLDLTQKTLDTHTGVIVFCGVRFMAETAAILNPDKTVLLPDVTAGCGLADMATVEAVKTAKRKHPDWAVVTYINSTAAVKAESHICCTSANAVRVVNALTDSEVLFVPDKHLGSYVAEKTDKNHE